MQVATPTPTPSPQGGGERRHPGSQSSPSPLRGGIKGEGSLRVQQAEADFQ